MPVACALPSREASTHPHGAIMICAGDVVDLEVEVHSMLPRALQVTNVRLTLLLVGGRGMKTDIGESLSEVLLHMFCTRASVLHTIGKTLL